MQSEYSDVVARFWKAFAGRDVPGAMALFHADATYEDFGARHLCTGLREITAFWNSFFENVSERDFLAQRDTTVLAADGHYATEWTMQFRLEGSFGDIKGTGQKLRFQGASVGRIVGGLIAFQRDYWDSGTVLQQLNEGSRADDT
jgi:ketosteroid isomerase-like protein